MNVFFSLNGTTTKMAYSPTMTVGDYLDQIGANAGAYDEGIIISGTKAKTYKLVGSDLQTFLSRHLNPDSQVELKRNNKSGAGRRVVVSFAAQTQTGTINSAATVGEILEAFGLAGHGKEIFIREEGGQEQPANMDHVIQPEGKTIYISTKTKNAGA